MDENSSLLHRLCVTSVPTDEQDYEAYLRKGGSAASPPTDVPKEVRFTLAIPGPLCVRLDQLRTRRLAKTSRHQWVLEAIEQRIERETEGS
jgi:hypothetical protein